MRITFRGLALLSCLAVSLMALTGAQATTRGFMTVSAHTNFTEPGEIITPSPSCPGPDCPLKTQGTTAYNGPEIYGTEDYTIYGGLPDPAHPGAFEFHGTAVVHVTKSRCGTGTFVERLTDGTFDPSKIDPRTQTIPVHDTWTIVAGSGTGQLAGIQGAGTDTTADATFTVAGVTGDPNANKGVHEGTLTCRVHPVSAAAQRPQALTFAGTESDPAGIHADGVSCSISAGGCRVVVTGNAAYAGGLTGSGAYFLRIDPVPQPDGLHYTGGVHFERIVTRCGTGAIDVDLRGVYKAATFDPASHSTTTVENATFRSGSGSGDLSMMTGGWTTILRDHNDGTTDGRYTGSMTCSSPRIRH